MSPITNVDPAFANEGTFTPDNLIAGDTDIATIDVTIASGQVLTRGALLGKISAGGEYILSLQAAIDGSEVPVAVLVEDVDASGGATEAPVFVAGSFNERAVTIGTGHTADSVREALAQIGIYLKKSVSA